jgi:hypothetical protein
LRVGFNTITKESQGIDMGIRVSKQHIETQGRAENSVNRDQKATSERSDSQLTIQAYQTILARELLIGDLNEQNPKYF